MSSSVSDVRLQARRAVHARFAVPCTYLASGAGAQAKTLTVRCQNRSVVNGKGDGTGYATLQEGYSRLVFSQDELTTQQIGLRRGGKVTLTDLQVTYTLFALEPSDGPINVSWIATEDRDGD